MSTDYQGEFLPRLKEEFSGKIVRKDLTKKIKEGANVPVYVLEYLLGMYCSSFDEQEIEAGVERVKKILADNYVRPDESQKVISKLREQGHFTVIDQVSVQLNFRDDIYEARFSNLGIQNVPIASKYPTQFERLLSGGIWCIVQMEYFYDEGDPKRTPFIIRELTPIQMPGLSMEEFKESRSKFTKEEWIDLVLRSIGMEPTHFNDREKWLHLIRLIPLVENNYNLCELGPRSTGKSHVYKEISPNSILVSGGQTTVANLFYNMSTRTVGLVGMWDCVAFDEVAGIKFRDQDGIQIMKDYMASGSFSRGKEEKNATASMVFVGNINQSVETILRTSHLFDPFPEEMGTDTAFLDRLHAYLPGWEIPKYRPDYFTDDYGFITDYLSEIFRELRKTSHTDAYDKYFRLSTNFNQRDVIAVKKTVSGLVKIVYPHGDYTKDDVEEILRLGLEMRRRVKEQLKTIGGMEFYDVNFSYIDTEEYREEYVSVPEQGSVSLIPEGMGKPGHVYTVGKGQNGMIGVYKLETQVSSGTGKFDRTGIGTGREIRESVESSFRYFRANAGKISGQIKATDKDFLVQVQDLNGIGMTDDLSLSTLIALASGALNRPLISSLAVLGGVSIGGTLIKVEELANTLQVCHDSGAKKVLLPSSSASDLGTVPSELVGAFNLIFYQSAEEAIYKALGVE